MSWSFFMDNPSSRNETFYDGMPMPDTVVNNVAAHESIEQWNTACRAVEALAKAVGRPDDKIQISMNGHANKGHAPAEGWADEYVTITIYARPPKET